MAASEPAPESQRQAVQTKRNFLPDGVSDIVTKSLQVGAGTGAFGALMGASTGIVTGTQFPVLYSLVTGLQGFAHGAVYYGSRHMILSRHGPVNTTTSRQQLEASSLGGAISGGTVVGIFRGPRTLFLGVLLGTVIGGGGQFAVNQWAASHKAEKRRDSWFNSKWSPLKKLTDPEYEQILEEKLLRLDAEIAIIDEDVAALRAQNEDQAKATKESPQMPPRKSQA